MKNVVQNFDFDNEDRIHDNFNRVHPQPWYKTVHAFLFLYYNIL